MTVAGSLLMAYVSIAWPGVVGNTYHERGGWLCNIRSKLAQFLLACSSFGCWRYLLVLLIGGLSNVEKFVARGVCGCGVLC